MKYALLLISILLSSNNISANSKGFVSFDDVYISSKNNKDFIQLSDWSSNHLHPKLLTLISKNQAIAGSGHKCLYKKRSIDNPKNYDSYKTNIIGFEIEDFNESKYQDFFPIKPDYVMHINYEKSGAVIFLKKYSNQYFFVEPVFKEEESIKLINTQKNSAYSACFK